MLSSAWATLEKKIYYLNNKKNIALSNISISPNLTCDDIVIVLGSSVMNDVFYEEEPRKSNFVRRQILRRK